MSLKDKLSPLVNHFSGSMKIRQEVGNPVPEPTVCYGHKELFRDIKSQNQYVEKLYELMKTRSVESRFDVFNNHTVSAHWVSLFVGESERSLTLFPEKITNHIEKIKLFAEANGVDIRENLKNIDNILEQYKTDPKLQEIRDYLQLKKDVTVEWDLAINESVAAIKKRAQEATPNLFNYSHVKYDTNIDTNPDLASIKNLVDGAARVFENNRTLKEPYLFDYSFIEDYIDRLNQENIEAFVKLRNAGVSLKQADAYILEHQSTPVAKDITGFLKEKIVEKTLKEQGINAFLEFSNSKIKEIILFSDRSMLMKNNENQYVDIFTSKQLNAIKNILVAEDIRNTFKKNPTVAKNFIDVFKKDPCLINLGAVLVAVNTYSTNLDFFNSKPFDIKAEYEQSAEVKSSSYKAIEDLDDKLNRRLKDQKVQLFAHSIASNKYKHLYNEESYKIIENIYDLKLKTDVFQDYIGKKIAAYKSPEEFNEGLSKFLASMNDFSMRAVLNKAENAGVTVISQADDILIVQVEDYEQSKLLGSSSWCIVRHESYFNSYTDGGNKQYFLFDFTKESADNESMIGFTIDIDGEHYAAHYKNDDEVDESSEILEYAHDVVREVNYKETINRTAKMNIS